PYTIMHCEKSIDDRTIEEHVLPPEQEGAKTGKRIAVIGSGPAGLAAAQQLARAGHQVTVYEKDDRIGGLLTYGIPDFKLEKTIVERRVAQMRAEGVEFVTSAYVGRDLTADDLKTKYDAVCVAIGSRVPRDLPVKGRELKGIHFAMDFLEQQNRRVAGE